MKLLGWVADVEMTLRRERQQVGIARAKAAGRDKGRKRKVAPTTAAQMLADGMTLGEIGERLGVSRQAVHKALKKARGSVADATGNGTGGISDAPQPANAPAD